MRIGPRVAQRADDVRQPALRRDVLRRRAVVRRTVGVGAEAQQRLGGIEVGGLDRLEQRRRAALLVDQRVRLREAQEARLGAGRQVGHVLVRDARVVHRLDVEAGGGGEREPLRRDFGVRLHQAAQVRLRLVRAERLQPADRAQDGHERAEAEARGAVGGARGVLGEVRVERVGARAGLAVGCVGRRHLIKRSG